MLPSGLWGKDLDEDNRESAALYNLQGLARGHLRGSGPISDHAGLVLGLSRRWRSVMVQGLFEPIAVSPTLHPGGTSAAVSQIRFSIAELH